MKQATTRRRMALCFFALFLALFLSLMTLPALGAEVTCEEADCLGHYGDDGFCTATGAHPQPAPLNGEDGFYEISNVGQLYWFAALVNGGEAEANARLTADLTVNVGLVEGENPTARLWTPIGTKAAPYRGTFDGAGHTVSGLYYYATQNNGTYVGFLGCSEGGTVKDLAVTDFYFQADYSMIGGIVGLGYSTQLIRCYAEGAIYARDNFSFAGGLGGVLKNRDGTAAVGCFADVSLRVTENPDEWTRYVLDGDVVGGNGVYAGGLAGLAEGVLSNCVYASATFDGDAVGDPGYEILDNTAAVAEGELANGLAAAILGEGWGQNVDNGAENGRYPVFGGARVYRGYRDCDDTVLRLSNTPLNPTRGHKHGHFAQGASILVGCVYCHEFDEALGSLTLMAPSGSLSYDGSAKVASYTCTLIHLPEESSEHPISYCCHDGCTVPGVHTASLTYGGATVTVRFEITQSMEPPADLSVTVVTDPKWIYCKDGGAKPTLKVLRGDTELTPDTDYRVSYSNNLAPTDGAVATVELLIEGYVGATQSVTFSVLPFPMSGVLFSSSRISVIYGTHWEDIGFPQLFVENRSNVNYNWGAEYDLVYGVDYTLELTEEEYKDLAVATTYTVSVCGIGRFTGTRTVQFTVERASMDGERFEYEFTNPFYTGGILTPEIRVYDTLTGRYLSENVDFANSSIRGNWPTQKNLSVGVQGKGNYQGTYYLDEYWQVLPASVPILVSRDEIAVPYSAAWAADVEKALSPTVTLVDGTAYAGGFRYSYRRVAETEYTEGLPSDTGEYIVRIAAAEEVDYHTVCERFVPVSLVRREVTLTALDQSSTHPLVTDAVLGETLLAEGIPEGFDWTVLLGLEGNTLSLSDFTVKLGEEDVTDYFLPLYVDGTYHTVKETYTFTEDGHFLECADADCDYREAEGDHVLAYTPNGTLHTASCPCGYEVTEEHSPLCTDCFFSLAGTQVNLGADLTLFFMVKVPEGWTAEEGPAVAVRFERNGVVTVAEDAVLKEGYLAFAFDRIAPQTIADPITATLLVDGETAETREGCSVEANLLSLLGDPANADDGELLALCHNILYYGRAAQSYTGYRPDSPIADGVTVTPTKETVTPYNISLFPVQTAENYRFTGVSMVFDTAPRHSFTLYLPDEPSEDFYVTALNMDTYESANYGKEDLIPLGEGRYRFVSPDPIPVTEYETVYLYFVNNGYESEISLQYQSENYISYAATSGKMSETMATLADAFHQYAKSVRDYVAALSAE